jgi:hypothetical protein
MTASVFARPGVAAAATPGTAARAAAVVALVVETAVHVYLAPDHLREMPYIGVGFALGAALSVLVLGGMLLARNAVWPWLFGAVLCAGMAVLFVASRTVGLPGYKETWTSDNSLGLLSTATELVVVSCAAVALRSATPTPGRRPAIARWRLRLQPSRRPSP